MKVQTSRRAFAAGAGLTVGTLTMPAVSRAQTPCTLKISHY